MHLRSVRAALLALLVAFVPALATAQVYRTYGDWSVACDNQRTCTAIGYAAEDDANAFVRVTRDGGANAVPVVELVVESDGRPRKRTLEAVFHGLQRGAVPVGPLTALGDGAFARARIDPAVATIVLGAMRDAKSLTIRLVDHATADETGTVLLDGSSAALRSMDAQQHRDGGVTALVARGPAPASAVPPVDAVPEIVARPMRALPTPASRGPKLVTDADPICSSAPEMWFALGGGLRLRGICSEGGAYNFTYTFFIVAQHQRPKRASFRAPWRAATPDDATLVNPSLGSDGVTLGAFAKGVGLGTCGEASDWAWTGRNFRLIRLTEMRECRGVGSDDWPIVYRAFVR